MAGGCSCFFCFSLVIVIRLFVFERHNKKFRALLNSSKYPDIDIMKSIALQYTAHTVLEKHFLVPGICDKDCMQLAVKQGFFKVKRALPSAHSYRVLRKGVQLSNDYLTPDKVNGLHEALLEWFPPYRKLWVKFLKRLLSGEMRDGDGTQRQQNQGEKPLPPHLSQAEEKRIRDFLRKLDGGRAEHEPNIPSTKKWYDHFITGHWWLGPGCTRSTELTAFADKLFELGGIKGFAETGHLLKEYKMFRKGTLKFRTEMKDRRMKTQASWIKEKPSEDRQCRNKKDCWLVGQIQKIIEIDIAGILPSKRHHQFQNSQVLVQCRWFQLRRTDPDGLYETGPELVRYQHSFGCVESVEPIRILANDHERRDGRYYIVLFDSGLPACMETVEWRDA